MPEVRMTVEEYQQLLEAIEFGQRMKTTKRGTKPPTVRSKKGKAAKGMGRAMKEANERLRTKSGKLRKGKTQADVARLAHKIRKEKYA